MFYSWKFLSQLLSKATSERKLSGVSLHLVLQFRNANLQWLSRYILWNRNIEFWSWSRVLYQGLDNETDATVDTDYYWAKIETRKTKSRDFIYLSECSQYLLNSDLLALNENKDQE